ncbi:MULTISPECIES: hypothetical protein [Halomonadaceae]|uniref:hypothetical protein n=1 Tax=Halomonadaceae TaxID=28256 RepID=UPI0012EFC20E|nr:MULTISPECIES: hypothetical protein [Halomonas]CAD5270185.1 conserved hypothetical protein [Halomonas sp. 156]CAD5280490.1 conserved hypothetical protein [Halomonas sp. 113]CAD5281958.1 conserved hypothetical protein [Halomonas sp. 59]CAD5288022.1 conserved hypothetical protein [Halomonas sp. I3]VXB12215.1 conserved hypothetical protein [Halomonas titanicae]
MLILISFLSSFFCLVWAVLDPSFASVAAFLASIVVVITFIYQKKNSSKSQQQQIKNGLGIQAGRDVSIGGKQEGDDDV